MTQPVHRTNVLILAGIAVGLVLLLYVTPPPLLATSHFQSPPPSPLGLGMLSVQIKVLLRGPYNSTNSLMNDTLRKLNLLPTAEPYSALSRFAHIGGETVNPTVFTVTGRNAIVDWVLVELRSSSDATRIIATRAALLQRDGDVVDIDGVSPVAFASLNGGSYYMAVGHRNHLRVMTAAPVTISPTATLLDFTNANTPTSGAYAQATVNNVRLLWSGDANTNNQVIYSGPNNDQNAVLTRVLTDPGNPQGNLNYIVNGYGVTDLNLDGKTIAAGPNNDINVILTTVLSHPNNSSANNNYVVQEQTPAGTWAPPIAASIPLPANIPNTAAYVIQERDFTTVWSAAAKVARWQRGYPVPATAYALRTPTVAQYPAKPGLLALAPAPVQQAPPSGWSLLYSENFDGNFPTPGQNGNCTLELRTKDLNYQWGRNAFRTDKGAGAAWPAAGGTLGPQQQPGIQTYPENLQTQIICRFANLNATNLKNIMVEFALWLDEGDVEDKFFLGFNTGETVPDPADPTKTVETFYGRSWRKTPAGADGNPTWQRYRFFYPELAAKVQTNQGKLAIMWSFTSDGNRRVNARGAWLDSINVERYLQPSPPNGVSHCEDLDPTISVPGAPGTAKVSKGLVLPPDSDDNTWAIGLDPALIRRMRETTTNWVRLEFIVQPSAFIRLLDNSTVDETIDLKHYDQLIDELCASKIAVLGLLSYQSLADRTWRIEGSDGVISDAYLTQFTNTLSLLLTYYGDRIGAWEVWNEPDYAETRLGPGAFAKLMVTAAPLIHNGGDTVVLGGLANVDTLTRDYFTQFYLAIAQEFNSIATPFDIFAIHPYPSEQYKDGNALALDPQSHWRKEPPTVFAKFQDILKGKNALGRDDSNKDAWVTEFGWNSARGSDADNENRCPNLEGQWIERSRQKLYLATGMDVLFRETAWANDKRPWITKTFWYQYRDTGQPFPVSKCTPQPTWYSPSWWTSWFWQLIYGESQETVAVPWSFGLYDGNYLPKETLCTFKNYPTWADPCYDLTRKAYVPIMRSSQTLSAASAENSAVPTESVGVEDDVVAEENTVAEESVVTEETACPSAEDAGEHGACTAFPYRLYLPVVSANQVESTVGE